MGLPIVAQGLQVCLSPELGSRMWVFRDGKKRVPTVGLWNKLRAGLSAHAPPLTVLLRAGELEAALADQGHPSGAIARVTDAAALALVREDAGVHSELAAPDGVPEEITIGTPEGFAFYLLHPLSFRDLARQVHLAQAPAAVIGIRSIGAALSAVVAMTLDAERITVRPTGHPYERATAITPAQQAWITGHVARDAMFYVVDEGPGFSGSSLLSACEALAAAGVPAQRITVLCTVLPDPTRLIAPNAAQRWGRYRIFKTTPYLPAAVRDAKWYNADHWRMRIYGGDESFWPGVWKNVETAKFLAPGDHRLFRFIGFAHYGEAVLGRYQRLAQAQLGPAASGEVAGFAQFSMLGGAAFTHPRWSDNIHDFSVRYLAVRLGLCAAPAQEAEDNLAELRRMVHSNTQELLGDALDPPLQLKYPVFADNRMQPYKFMRTPSGMRKLDGAAHGDDHFFPGPCDIAWDIAGLIAEWDLSADACERWLRDYCASSGDRDIRSRLRGWTIAYLAFRCGYCLMGANAHANTGDGRRLLRDAERYGTLLREASLPRAAA